MAVNLLSDGTTRVSWVVTIASQNAPTAAELNAGIALETLMTADGLDIPGSTASIDTSSLASTFSSNDVGRRSFGPIMLTLKRQAQLLSGDAARNALIYLATGFIVVRRGIVVATAYVAGQEVEVYPGRVGAPLPVKVAPNDLHKYTVPVNVTADVSPNAIVA